MPTTIKVFKVDKQEYKVQEHEAWGLNTTKWYSVETPENAFGYPDYFFLSYDTNGNPFVYSLHRWHSSRVHKACLKYLVQAYILKNDETLKEIVSHVTN